MIDSFNVFIVYKSRQSLAGTNAEPWYDERLSWEGRSDKMDQALKLCLLDYDFFILDNAFLIHRYSAEQCSTVQ